MGVHGAVDGGDAVQLCRWSVRLPICYVIRPLLSPLGRIWLVDFLQCAQVHQRRKQLLRPRPDKRVVPSKSKADMQNSCQHAPRVHTQRSNLLRVPRVATTPIRARAVVPAVDHANAQQPGVIDWQDVDQPLIWRVSGTWSEVGGA